MSSARFSADYAKRASNCKKCKQPLEKTKLRLAKISPNPFASDGEGDMKAYYHLDCLFDTFTRVRPGTKVVESPADLEDWAGLEDADKAAVLAKIKDLDTLRQAKAKGPAKKRPPPKASPKGALDGFVTKTPVKSPKDETKTPVKSPKEEERESTPLLDDPTSGDSTPGKGSGSAATEDDSLAAFAKLCRRMAKESKYGRKTEVLADFVHRKRGGVAGKGYGGDLHLLVKLLIPKADQRVYNVKEKALVKLFAELLRTDGEAMTEHFNECGEIADTLAEFFQDKDSKRRPRPESTMTLHDVDRWLDEMTKKTREEEQLQHFAALLAKATAEDLRLVVRMLKKDLRMNAGAKHVLDALDPKAYDVFQSSRDLAAVVRKVEASVASPLGKGLSVGCRLGTPVLPMLAEACRSVDFAMKRCPNGMYAEIKYDGERVQVHKTGSTFTYYSRSLKPVQAHKVEHFSTYIPQAFPQGGDLILDAEVLLIDRRSSRPLPFGTLGKHKKGAFSDAQVCLFVFDCLMYQGKSLMGETMEQRRRLLETSMSEVRNRVHFSDKELVKHGDTGKLRAMIAKAIDEGLEGLVLKDLRSTYEPGKRHWLKVKKDYLHQGSMADTADLVVLGGNFGTGNKGGLVSVFLMGVRDEKGTFRTVTKVGNGHDDATLQRINRELKDQLVKISKDADRLPTWLRCARSNAPDFVVKDPAQAPVWEITGAEFSKSSCHTADGVSIRFPRVTRIRDDKDVEGATTLKELKRLYAVSRETQTFTSIAKGAKEEAEEEEMDVRLPGLGPSSQDAALDSDEVDSSPKAKTSPTKTKEIMTPPLKTKVKDEKPSEPSPSSDEPSPPSKKRPERAAAKKSKAKAPKDSFISDDEEEEDFSDPEPEESDSDSGASIASADGSTSRRPGKARGDRAKAQEACRYGATCYQRNPAHRARFSHPTPSAAERPSRKRKEAEKEEEAKEEEAKEEDASPPKKDRKDVGAKLGKKDSAASRSHDSEDTVELKRSSSSTRGRAELLKEDESPAPLSRVRSAAKDAEAKVDDSPPAKLTRVRSDARKAAEEKAADQPAKLARVRSKDKVDASGEAKKTSDGSPSFFSGLKAFVGGKSGRKIGRYIGYYGGSVVEEAAEADVVVGEERLEGLKAPQVKLHWVTDSVRRQKRLPLDGYKLL